ncbi:pilus assembly protein [Polaromonas sp. YR568]|uniref:pilus assembly protein n=1 Tax=Polaromonas sp. YR568 TaxID=1855301 RepID=UPI00398BF02F
MPALLCRMLAGCATAFLATNYTLAEVAQEPLLSKTINVKPNIALLLDTSGSMGRDCVYAPPLARAMDRENVDNFPCILFPNLTYTSPLSKPFEAAFLQSPFNNPLYYDPRKTYTPGYKKGKPVTSKDVPVDATSVVTLYQPKDEATKKLLESEDPNKLPTILQFQTESNYSRREITTVPFSKNPFGPHNGKRRDCAGDTCTYEEERRNIANWRAAHRFRLFAAKNGLSAAFARQADNFRLTYTTIYQSLLSPLTPRMKDFGLAKKDFFEWLDALPNDGATPLRSSLKNAGTYFLDIDKSKTGPWASTPWLTSTEDPKNHLSCRRSHTILITDGYWTDTDPANGDSDSVPGPVYTHARDATITYQYKPGDKHPLSLGKSDNKDGTSGATCSPGPGVYCAKDTLADIAFLYWAADLRPDLANDASKGGQNDPPFWQNMTTHAVSFGAQGSLSDADTEAAKKGERDWPAPSFNTRSTIDDLRHAAHNGGGKFLMVTDAAQFSKDLGDIIGQIAGQRLSESGVAALGTALDTNAGKFVPSYNNGNWWGNLQKVKPGGPDGGKDVVEWQVIKTDAGGQPTGETTLPSPAARKIFVWVDAGKQAIEFIYANINLPGNKLKGGNDKLQMSNAVDADLVNFLRGDRAQEGSVFRSRAAVLGDIVNSTPVFIKNNTNPKYEMLPGGTPGLDLYASYMKDKRDRSEGVLFVGANDGMLHAFAGGSDTTTGGRELFAYVPRSVLGKMESLASITYAHTYLVDGPLNEVDAYVAAGPTPGWKNLVVGTTGAGAKAVFALDVTKPLTMDGKSVLWEINPDPAFPVLPGNGANSFQELGHVLSAVQSGITQSGNWVTIFGNGYDSKSGQASLFIVETGSGKLLKEIKTDNTSGNGLGGVRLVLNSMRQIIGAYAGDLQGRLWKFDLSGATPDKWALGYGGRAMFTAQNEGKALPITAQPAVVERSDQPNYRPSYLVTVGTGKLFETGDLASTTPVQAVYGLWDTELFGASGGKTITDDQLEGIRLVPVTKDIVATAGSTLTGGPTTFYTLEFINSSVTSIDWIQKRGWKMNMNVFPGQRNVSPLQAIGEVVQINPITPPASGESCQASSSTSISIFVNPLTGACRRGGTLDTNADGNIDNSDANVCALTAAADGSDVFFTIPNEDGIVRVDNAFGHGKVRIFDKKQQTCSDPTYAAANTDKCSKQNLDCKDPVFRQKNPALCPASIINRSWRQIFPRAN